MFGGRNRARSSSAFHRGALKGSREYYGRLREAWRVRARLLAKQRARAQRMCSSVSSAPAAETACPLRNTQTPISLRMMAAGRTGLSVIRSQVSARGAPRKLIDATAENQRPEAAEAHDGAPRDNTSAFAWKTSAVSTARLWAAAGPDMSGTVLRHLCAR
jgi:hypothetical protein